MNKLGIVTIDHRALLARQSVQTKIAQPLTSLTQPVAKRDVIVPRRSVAQTLAIGTDNAAYEPLADHMTRSGMCDCLPLRDGRSHF